MSRLFLILTLFCSVCFAKISWTSEHAFSLKKDEFGIIYLQEKGKKKADGTYVFKFRWTLYDSMKVVVLSNYRGFPGQHVMYFNNRLKVFRQNLLGREYQPQRSYILVQMDSFKKQNGEILFFIFIKDDSGNFDIKYIDPKRNKTNDRKN